MRTSIFSSSSRVFCDSQNHANLTGKFKESYSENESMICGLKTIIYPVKSKLKWFSLTFDNIVNNIFSRAYNVMSFSWRAAFVTALLTSFSVFVNLQAEKFSLFFIGVLKFALTQGKQMTFFLFIRNDRKPRSHVGASAKAPPAGSNKSYIYSVLLT